MVIAAECQGSPAPGTSTSTVVRKDGAYALRFTGDRLGFLLWMGDTVQALVAKKTDWTAGQWYHVAATYDGRLMRIFIDGKEAAGSPRRQTGLIDVSVNNCGVGAYGGGGRFHGLIDEARVPLVIAGAIVSGAPLPEPVTMFGAIGAVVASAGYLRRRLA